MWQWIRNQMRKNIPVGFFKNLSSLVLKTFNINVRILTVSFYNPLIKWKIFGTFFSPIQSYLLQIFFASNIRGKVYKWKNRNLWSFQILRKKLKGQVLLTTKNTLFIIEVVNSTVFKC